MKFSLKIVLIRAILQSLIGLRMGGGHYSYLIYIIYTNPKIGWKC